MGYNQCPCRDCKMRTPYCHASCEAYIDWKIDNDNRREQIHKNRELGHRAYADTRITYRKSRKIRWDQ